MQKRAASAPPVRSELEGEPAEDRPPDRSRERNRYARELELLGRRLAAQADEIAGTRERAAAIERELAQARSRTEAVEAELAALRERRRRELAHARTQRRRWAAHARQLERSRTWRVGRLIGAAIRALTFRPLAVRGGPADLAESIESDPESSEREDAGGELDERPG